MFWIWIGIYIYINIYRYIYITLEKNSVQQTNENSKLAKMSPGCTKIISPAGPTHQGVEGREEEKKMKIPLTEPNHIHRKNWGVKYNVYVEFWECVFFFLSKFLTFPKILLMWNTFPIKMCNKTCTFNVFF